MDPMDRIDQIISLVETARNVPMSRNCMIDRGEMIGLLEQLRVELPGEMRRAAALLDERDKILDAGPAGGRADDLRGRGGAPPARLAQRGRRLRRPGGHPDRSTRPGPRRSGCATRWTSTSTPRLANFEQFLTRSLASIERGRDKMHALREIGAFQGDDRDHQLPF